MRDIHTLSPSKTSISRDLENNAFDSNESKVDAQDNVENIPEEIVKPVIKVKIDMTKDKVVADAATLQKNALSAPRSNAGVKKPRHSISGASGTVPAPKSNHLNESLEKGSADVGFTFESATRARSATSPAEMKNTVHLPVSSELPAIPETVDVVTDVDDAAAIRILLFITYF